MAYSQVSAANVGQVIDAIVTFAVANGWALEYDVNAAEGKQIGIKSGACNVAIGLQPGSPIALPAGWGSDTRICMALTSAFSAGRNYWSHGNVSTPGDRRRVVVNDLTGPMTAIHLFGDERSIFVVVKSTSTRWTTFGFGLVDRAGAEIAFCAGEMYKFWYEGFGYDSQYVGASKAFHGGRDDDGYGAGLTVLVPNGILDPTFGFSGGVNFMGYEYATPANVDALMLPLIMSNVNPAIGGDRSKSSIIEPAWETTPTLTTGGMALLSVPVIAVAKTTANLSFLGNLPIVRLCRAPTVTAGDIVLYGDDEYMVFPMKQKGAATDTAWGGVDNQQPNSLDFSYALKKA